MISVEASRSAMEVLDVFAGELEDPNEIGPGVYDFHSPRARSTDEVERLLELAEERVGRERLWSTPTAGWRAKELRVGAVHVRGGRGGRSGSSGRRADVGSVDK